jgi:hypothetical protein
MTLGWAWVRMLRWGEVLLGSQERFARLVVVVVVVGGGFGRVCLVLVGTVWV